MELLAPLVKSRKYGKEIPVYILYRSVMKQIDPNNYDNEKDKERAKKQREKLIKTSILTDAPEEYWHIGYCEETGMDYNHFINLPLGIRAKHLARRSLASMVDIVD